MIQSRISTVAEIVKDGITGFHLNGKNTQAIVAQLRALRTDPARYQTMSRQATPHATAFSESLFLNQSLRLIEQGSRPETGALFQNME